MKAVLYSQQKPQKLNANFEHGVLLYLKQYFLFLLPPLNSFIMRFYLYRRIDICFFI